MRFKSFSSRDCRKCLEELEQHYTCMISSDHKFSFDFAVTLWVHSGL